MNIDRLRNLTTNRPYLTATAVGCAWVLAWLWTMPIKVGLAGLFIAAIPIGLIVGASRVSRWYDCLKTLPAMAGIFFIASCVYAVVGLMIEDYHGDQAGMVILVLPMFVCYALPILLGASFVGSIVLRKRGV